MKKLLLTSAICLLSSSAFAWDWGGNGCDPCGYDSQRRERIREYRRERERRQEWRAEHGYAPYAQVNYRERRAPERREWRERDRDGYRERDRDHDGRCRPAIYVVGEADHLKEAAKRSAIHIWQMQIQHEFGEKWMDFDSAEVLDEHFDVAGLGADVITNTKRYVITARPCLRRGNADVADEGK